MERVVEIEKFESENEYEQSIRPSKWDEYIGQDRIKSQLQVAIKACKIREDVIDHMLFSGPPGLGKTTLAHIIAHQMDANIKITAAPMIEKPGDLAAILTNLEEGDMLFIDEIHRLSPSIEEILYPAMEDFRLDIIAGSGPAAQTIKIDLPRFTLIGATTRAGLISNPLRDRFIIPFRMDFYSENDLARIIINASRKLNKEATNDAAYEIAKRSRGTPRIALRLLRRVRDYAEVEGESGIEKSRAEYALNELGINDHGFDEMDIKFLKILAQNSKRATGLNALAAALREDEGTIEDVIEPFLLASGYIERTARGRLATKKTFDVLEINYNKGLF
ncbi:MAG: Holliday junction branch migration DNA helicase RuvB [Campylobacterales bacterium]